MQMGNGLSGFGADVRDQTPAVFQMVFLGELACGRETRRKDGGVLGGGLGERRNGFHRDHQRVEGRLRLDILDREAEFFAQEEPGWDGAFVDLLEEGAAHGSKSIQCGVRRGEVECHSVISIHIVLALLALGKVANAACEPGHPLWLRACDKRGADGLPLEPGSRAWEDAPVRSDLLDSLRGRGWIVRTTLKWDNLVSASPERADATLPACLEVHASVAQVVPSPKPVAPVAARALSVDPALVTLRRMHDTLGVTAIQDTLRARFGEPGLGIRIAVIDDGFVRQHNVLAGANIVDAWDFVSNDSIPWDESAAAPWAWDHGTATVGLIASQWDDVLPGIAPAADLMLYRTEDDVHETYAEEDYLAAAFQRAVDSGAHVISTSLGYRYAFDNASDHPASSMDGRTLVASRTASWAASRGVVVVASVGNEGEWGSQTVNSPADADSIIAVGAVSESHLRCSFSSKGPTADGRIKPELVAFGCSIPVANGDAENGYYEGGLGTSYAAPLVAGMAALLRQIRPSWTAMDVRDSLVRSGSNASSPDNLLGWGVPDLRRIASIVEHSKSPSSPKVPRLSCPFHGSLGFEALTEDVIFSFRTLDGRVVVSERVSRGRTFRFATPPPGVYVASWKGATIDASRVVPVP